MLVESATGSVNAAHAVDRDLLDEQFFFDELNGWSIGSCCVLGDGRA